MLRREYFSMIINIHQSYGCTRSPKACHSREAMAWQIPRSGGPSQIKEEILGDVGIINGI